MQSFFGLLKYLVKFLTQEEKKKLEEKLRIDKERLLAQQEDDYRARALIDMMNGKLDDR